MSMSFTRTQRRWLVASCLMCLNFAFIAPGLAEDTPPAPQPEPTAAPSLPEPLTLPSLIALPLTTSPEVLIRQAKLEQAQAQIDLQAADTGYELNAIGRIGWREYANKTEDNHLLALHFGKQLYDFGRNEAAVSAQQSLYAAASEAVEDQKRQFQLTLMQSFFNVILADFQYRIENEDMAVAYIAMDKARDRHELNRISDVEYLKIESDYEKILVRRSRAEYDQRQTRAFLANLAGQPDALPDKLAFPKLAGLGTETLKPLKEYQDAALANNLSLAQLKLQLTAAQHQLEAADSNDLPTFRVDAWGGKLSTYEYQREGRWRFDLSMNYPLYDSGLTSAKVSKARGHVQQLQAQIQSEEQRLRDQVADLYFKLQLAKAERKQNKIFGDYADLYLDYSRALYENESATDLGDSMVQLSVANYNVIEQNFREALNWAHLHYLTGQPITTAFAIE